MFIERDELVKDSFRLIKPVVDMRGVYSPNYKRNITMVLPTLMRTLGLDLEEANTLLSDRYLKSYLEEVLSSRVENIVFLVIDSLGFQQFTKYSKLLSNKAFYFPISSVFPTITSTAIMSLHTGKYPEQHGVLGYKIFIEELGTIIDTLKFSTEKAQYRDSLTRIGLNFSNFIWEESLHKKIDSERILDVSLYNYSIANTGLSTVLHPNIVSFGDMIDGFSLVNKLLCKSDGKRKLIHIYMDSVDELSHKYGPESFQIELNINLMEKALKALSSGIPPGEAEKTVLVLASDHGQSRVDPQSQLNLQDMDSEQGLRYFRSAVGKSGRTLHFYVKRDKIEEAYNFISERIGENGLVFRFDDLRRRLGLKAGRAGKVKNRLGDIICVLTAEKTAQLRSSEAEAKIIDTPLLGQHGGLSYEELCSICAFINLKEL